MSTLDIPRVGIDGVGLGHGTSFLQMIWVVIGSLLASQLVAAEPTWDPGIPGGIPHVTAVHSVMDFGAKGDGVTDDSNAFQQALDALPPGLGAVAIPPGTYLLKSTLHLDDGNVLRGSGADRTFLRFDSSGSGIEALTYGRGTWTDATAGFSKGSTELTVADASSFTVPTFAEIKQTNDPDVLYTKPDWDVSWAKDSVGEIIRVIGKSGNRLILEEPIHFSYDPNMDPQVRTQDFIEWVGVEDLYIERLDTGDSYSMFFKNVAYPWVRGVESAWTHRAHIHAETVYRGEFRGSYFHHAHNYGVGGHGYGVSFIIHTTSCLVEDNIFDHLRHSMIMQVGANGNVFGYNYSRDPQDPNSYVQPDMSFHGHYPFYNLAEGNVIQRAGITDWWGPGGPDNILLRNCVQTIGIEIDDYSHGVKLLGNYLESGTNIEIDSTVRDSYLHGNLVNGAIQWDPDNPDHSIPDSLYHSNKPIFFGVESWPSIGGDLGFVCRNPAYQRWQNGKPIVPKRATSTPLPIRRSETPTPTPTIRSGNGS